MSPSDATPTVSRALDEHVEVEKLRLLYSNAHTPIVALAISAVIVATVMYFSAGVSWMPAWLVLHLVLSAARLFLLRQFRQHNRLPDRQRFWAWTYTVSLAIISLMWGWIALHFDTTWPLDDQIIVLTFLVGICAAGGLSHAFYLPAYMALLIPILCPLVWRMLSIPQASYMLLGAGTIVFSVYMAILTRRYTDTSAEFIELRFQNQDLVENLSEVNEELQREVAEHSRALEALAGRSRVLEALARGDSLREVLDRLIISMEQVLPGTRAMVSRLEPDRTTMRFVAGPNLSSHFIETFGEIELHAGMAPGRERVIQEQLAEQPLDEKMLEMVRRHGFQSSWSEPILSGDGDVMGTLTVYFRNRKIEHDEFESDYIQTTAQLAGIAIERKNTEANLEQARRHLEERVEARTRELHLVVREVESFNYSVSHDLRSPLRAIDGYSQIVLEDFGDQLPAEVRDYLGRCRTASQRMGQLIDGLLKISRLSRKDLERSWVNFSNICEGIAERLSASDPGRKVQWEIQRGITLWGDSALLEAVAENLLANAWKFSAGQDHTRIEIGAEEVEASVKVWIRDNGAGFDMAYADKLFHPFQRLHDDKQFKGTGIGLATVERIIRRHEGRIWADSQPGQGACFSFALPLLEVSPQYPLLEELSN